MVFDVTIHNYVNNNSFFIVQIANTVAVYLLLVTDFMFSMYRDIGAEPNVSWFILLFAAIVLSIIFIFAFKRFYLDE